MSVAAAIGGIIGVALLVLRSEVRFDTIGIMAALGSAVAVAFGTVMTRKWSSDIPPLVLTSWQLTAGGLLLVPISLLAEPSLPPLNGANLVGLTYLVVLTALTYVLWFRGISALGPSAAAALAFLSPVSAIMLGWLILGQALSPLQILGAIIVLLSIYTSQSSERAATP